jgi:hypothetical protein
LHDTDDIWFFLDAHANSLAERLQQQQQQRQQQQQGKHRNSCYFKVRPAMHGVECSNVMVYAHNRCTCGDRMSASATYVTLLCFNSHSAAMSMPNDNPSGRQEADIGSSQHAATAMILRSRNPEAAPPASVPFAHPVNDHTCSIFGAVLPGTP